MRLIGVDVGFSTKRKTTGVACLDGEKLSVIVADTSWASRSARIPEDFCADAIAIDGPLLPDHAHPLTVRNCERLFSFAPFQKRCKPGHSHFGTGLKLREAARECCMQFDRSLNSPNGPESHGRIRLGGPIVEAFPNAFLGVFVEEKEYQLVGKLRRGKKFDWLYDRAAKRGKLKVILSEIVRLPDEVWNRLETERGHEERAALICLLTAALVATNSADPEHVGDDVGGWFCLPPRPSWAKWADAGLEAARRKLESQ